jgi:hypothetical protein
VVLSLEQVVDSLPSYYKGNEVSSFDDSITDARIVISCAEWEGASVIPPSISEAPVCSVFSVFGLKIPLQPFWVGCNGTQAPTT